MHWHLCLWGIFCKLASPQFTRHISWRSLTLPFELMGAELIEMLVASSPIVETLVVIENICLGLSPGAVNLRFDLPPFTQT